LNTSADASGGRAPPDPGPSLRLGRYVFRRARTRRDFAALHRLNHRTFVRELSQHADNGLGRLVDKFHDKNLYFVAMSGERVVGMLSVHDRPPFSVADKLADPLVLDRLGPHPLEVRLLAVEPAHRRGTVFSGLALAVLRHAQREGYSHLLISGVADRRRMYERMGFTALGPAVREGGSAFVPMVATLAGMPKRILEDAGWLTQRSRRDARTPDPSPMSFTPGHAQLSPSVARAALRHGIDHRGPVCRAAWNEVRAALAALVRAAPPALFCGSGTLANEVVALTLAADRRRRRGLVLVNGEFGRRLATQADRAGLDFERLEWSWGAPWDLDRVDRALAASPSPDWVWAVHLESSTGMLNDVRALEGRVRARGAVLCVDAISSLGAVPLELSEAHLATGVANKSLGGVAGLSMVWAGTDALDGVDASRIPTYLDLTAALEHEGPRFTLPSGPLLALQAALLPFAGEAGRRRRFARHDMLGRLVRDGLLEWGASPLVEARLASPLITTFTPPPGVHCQALLEHAREEGFVLGGGSDYLRERGWLQIATMGDVHEPDCRRVLDCLAEISR
jgi:aspartate aminotransferase-like enzyme/predicted N-acetyltransferase YhbS